MSQVQRMLTEDRCLRLLGLDQISRAGLTVSADGPTGTVVVQGEFWYRGEYTFASHPEGVEITYRIKNVSGMPDRLVRLWQRSVLRRQQQDLDRLAASLPSRVR
jgi:hypothetical protein